MKVLKFLFFLSVGFLIIAIMFNIVKDIPIEDLKLKYAQSPSQFIKIQNINVHYRIEGPVTDSLPIILIHGTGASLHTFDAWSKELSKTRKVIRMDLPGFGLTGPFSDRDYSMMAYISFLDDFLGENKISKCILAGNSLGGNVAWHYVLSHPEKVEKLILIDAAGLKYDEKKPPIAFKIARIPILNKIMTFITPRSIVKKSIEDVYADKSLVSEKLVDRYYDLALREGNRQAMVDRLTASNDYSAVPDLKKISIPTLILWGENDLLIPASISAEFSKQLPNAT